MRIRTRSLLIIFSQGMTQFATILLGIILVRIISKETLGTYRQLKMIYVSLVCIMSLQLDNSLYYFIPKLGISRRKTILTHTLGITFIFSALIALVIFMFRGTISTLINNPRLYYLLGIYSIFPFVERVVNLLPAYFISLDRTFRASAYTLVATVGRVVLVTALFATGYNLTTVVWATVVFTGIIAAVGIIDMFRFVTEGVLFDFLLLKEQLSYCWPLLATAVCGTINVQFDKFLISYFFDVSQYAVYTCGAIQLPIINLITTSVAVAIMPTLVVMVSMGRKKDALLVWQESARKCSLIILPCFVLFLLIGVDVILLLYREPYINAAWPFYIYLFLMPLRIVIHASLIRAVGKTGCIAIGSVIVLVVNIVLSTTLAYLGRGGILTFIGPAIGTIIAEWCSWMYLLSCQKRNMQVSYREVLNWDKLLNIFFLCAISCLPVVIVYKYLNPLILRIVISSSLYFIILIFLFLATKTLKQDELEMLKAPLEIIKKAKKRFIG